MATTIADQLGPCIQRFESVITALSDSSAQNARIVFVDEFDRFKLWAGNIGAHRLGQSSLDYRLRDASHIQKRVLQFLLDLQSSLEEGELL
jgi:hypothetical protein